MLSEQRPGDGGCLAVLTRNATFNRLMEAILEEWHYHVAADPAAADLLLVERGMTIPAADSRVIWLTPLPLGEEPHLEVPLSLTDLYHRLERRFFPQPRNHIRLALNQEVDLNVRGVWLVGRLLSLSDRGARLASAAHLPKGEKIQLDFRLAKYPLRLSAEVLYEIPAGDSPGREQPQAGLLFKPPRPALRLALRQFIERSYVERACAKTGIAVNDPSLSWIGLVKNPWEKLTG